MDDALQSAGRELGDEALILNTRESPQEFRHFGKYEVVCAVADVVEPQRTRIDDVQPVPVQDARVLFLVGPSGSGKSTTCAKIAIHAKLHKGLNPAVISWDTGRVCGSESLRAYCEIAGLPIHLAATRNEFEQILKRCAANDLVIVDTPSLEGGSSPRVELLASLRSLPSAEVHLVLSSTFSESYLASSATSYASFSPSYLLPTHLDEARMDLDGDGLKGLRELAIQWCGTGRSVPEDLHDAGQAVQQAKEPAPKTEDVDGFRIAASFYPEPVATPRSTRKTIDSIFARFRRRDLTSLANAVNEAKSSAA